MMSLEGKKQFSWSANIGPKPWNSQPLFVCSEEVKSDLVKLETSSTVILPTLVSVPWLNYKLLNWFESPNRLLATMFF